MSRKPQQTLHPSSHSDSDLDFDAGPGSYYDLANIQQKTKPDSNFYCQKLFDALFGRLRTCRRSYAPVAAIAAAAAAVANVTDTHPHIGTSSWHMSLHRTISSLTLCVPMHSLELGRVLYVII